jgi:small ligand-binding sensory domain FIST
MSISRPVPAATARVGFGAHPTWERALADATAALAGLEPDLVIVVCGSTFVDDMPAIANEVWRSFHAPFVFGASGRGVIAQDTEHEQGAAVAVMGLCLPGAVLSPIHLSLRSLGGMTSAAACHRRLNVIPEDVNGWLMLANPFRFDTQLAITRLEMAYPETVIVGGLASPDAGTRQTALLINGEAVFDGAVALGIGGAYDLLPMVSHGCEPIGQTWTITGVEDEWIAAVGGRPTIQVIDDILQSTPHDLRERTRRNLLVGLAVDEYRAEFGRGDFIVRSIAGIDQRSGAIAVSARARAGQTLQFQLRDALTADHDLGICLEQLHHRQVNVDPIAVLAFAGQERGRGLFDADSHDARAIQRVFPGIPTLGLFTTAEIGPAGTATGIHTMSLTAGLITRRSEEGQEPRASA